MARAVRGGLVGGCFTAGRSKRPSLPARGPSGEKRPIEVQVHAAKRAGFFILFLFLKFPPSDVPRGPMPTCAPVPAPP